MSFHQFSANNINGKEIDFSRYKGKKLLVVNTASECGLTPQYKQLQELYTNFGGENFEIIGFPANNFGAQEPGTNQEINNFCSVNYGVTFTMMEKISVQGSNIHPIYQWLTQKEKNGKENAEVSWNFQKFLIDEHGNWVDVVAPTESPLCDKILNFIHGN